MKVILLQDIDKLGKKYEIKEVARGYAVNFLIPKKLAVIATPTEIKKIEKEKERERERREKEMEKMKELAKSIEGLKIEVLKEAQKDGTLYGSVTKREIAEKLKEKGFEINEENIGLKEPIKKLGEYKISVNLSSGVTATIKVEVKKA